MPGASPSYGLYRVARLVAAAIAVVLLVALVAPTRTTEASAPPTLCGLHIDRTQTVSIDPDLSPAGLTRDDVLAAMQSWNALWVEYHGFPAFTAYGGDWRNADVLVTAHGYDTTWVSGACDPHYVQRGNNQNVIFFGAKDAWRNATVAAEELGHALWLPDFGPPGAYVAGMLMYVSCDHYVGVMSFCSSPQSWFLDDDLTAAGFDTDGTFVRDYYGGVDPRSLAQGR